MNFLAESSGTSKTDRGEMLFGGPNGFNAFFPGQLRGNLHVPPVEITGFLKFNKPFDLGSPLWATEKVELGYRDSVVAFDFAALDYTAPEKNRYLHKLEGFDRPKKRGPTHFAPDRGLEYALASALHNRHACLS